MRHLGQSSFLILATAVLACAPAPSGQAGDRPADTATVTKLVEIPHPELDTMDETVRRRLEKLRAEAGRSAAEPPRKRAKILGDLGRTYMAFVFAQAAEACFQNAQRLEPENPVWAYYLGVLRQQRGALEPAVESFERVASLAPEDLAARVRLGRAWLELSRNEAAADAFGTALELEPGSSAALYGLGRAAAARDDFATAIDYFEQALAQLPDDTVVHHALGQALRRAGRLDEARHHLERPAERPVAFPDPLIDAVSRLAQQTALEVVRSLAADPAVAGDDFLGFALSRLGEVEGAAEKLERALEQMAAGDRRDRAAEARLHEVAGILWGRAATGRAATGRAATGRAVAHFRAAVGLDPGLTGAWLRLGDALAATRRYQAALEPYGRVLRLQPENREALLKQATVRVELGRFAEALPDLRRLVDLEPDNGRARLRLATALRGLGEDSLRHWQAALELDLPDRERAFAWFGLANELNRRRRFEEALAAYRSALELEPKSTGAWLNLATLLDHLGRREEASRAYARLEDLQR